MPDHNAHTEPANFAAFICHAAADATRASEIASALEARGHRVWIAPRDVPAGAEYRTTIGQAMQQSRCVVLVLSQEANDSQAVQREVTAAVTAGKPIFPVRIEDVAPSPQLQVHLAAASWIDLWTDAKPSHFDQLAQSLCDVSTPSTPAPMSQPRRRSAMPAVIAIIGAASLLVLIGIAAVGVGVAAVQLGWFDQSPPEATPVALRANEPPLPDESEIAVEELLQRLLRAIDASDYAAVKVYATALFEQRGDLEIVEYRRTLRQPVIAAAVEGDLRMFSALVNAKPVLTAEDERGREIIHVAAINGHDQLLALLVNDLKIGVDRKTEGTGLTALHWAVTAGQVHTIETLRQLGGDPNAGTHTGQTALHLAAEARDLNAIHALCRPITGTVASDVNRRDTRGRTALHIAARTGSGPVAQHLLDIGADPSIQDSDGDTPGSLAYEAGHDDLAALLGHRP